MYAIIFLKNIYLKRSKMVLRIIKSRNDLHIVLDIIIKRSIVIIIEVLLCKSRTSTNKTGFYTIHCELNNYISLQMETPKKRTPNTRVYTTAAT